MKVSCAAIYQQVKELLSLRDLHWEKSLQIDPEISIKYCFRKQCKTSKNVFQCNVSDVNDTLNDWCYFMTKKRVNNFLFNKRS